MLKRTKPIVITYPTINVDEMTPEQLYRHIRKQFVEITIPKRKTKSA